jgi:hypothetical protein
MTQYGAPSRDPLGSQADVMFGQELTLLGDSLGTKVATPCATHNAASAQVLRTPKGLVREMLEGGS